MLFSNIVDAKEWGKMKGATGEKAWEFGNGGREGISEVGLGRLFFPCESKLASPGHLVDPLSW